MMQKLYPSLWVRIARLAWRCDVFGWTDYIMTTTHFIEDYKPPHRSPFTARLGCEFQGPLALIWRDCKELGAINNEGTLKWRAGKSTHKLPWLCTCAMFWARKHTGFHQRLANCGATRTSRMKRVVGNQQCRQTKPLLTTKGLCCKVLVAAAQQSLENLPSVRAFSRRCHSLLSKSTAAEYRT